MKYQDIKALPTKELFERYREEKLKLTKLKINHAVTPLDQPHQIGESRKHVAQLLTELNNRRKDYELKAIQNKAK
ncbi:MAG: 50S ribosomal protein L29 [Bacteroidia bacterium]|jgi:large subunit ribosomal protein L29|nr:50S ribosomal protein L29 [Bacteroidia bacterium]MCO5254051.1 50S ribosomal protein L29 [Bacteroidota bacterium]MCZ2131480.1 50S ribosomal protein L29 [Bacteroidia bacterium]